jgi:hypothetical protein
MIKKTNLAAQAFTTNQPFLSVRRRIIFRYLENVLIDLKEKN